MIKFIKKEAVFCISALLAIISVFIVPPDAQYVGYINYRVLGLLFALMTVVEGLRGIRVFDIAARRLADRCGTVRGLVFVLTGLCFFSAMFITNDVALITFVPLAIGVLTMSGNSDKIIYTVILQTIAANMGSMLTPMGNPQNLYLADKYKMTTAQFFGTTLPVWAVSGVIIALLHLFIKNNKLTYKSGKVSEKINKKMLIVYAVLGILSVLSVFDLIDYKILTAVTLVCVFIADKAVLKRIDWFLLLTFTMFFVFVGNVARIDSVRQALSSLVVGREIVVSAALSQLISNVPAAVMLSGFTDNGKALLLGIDIGGLGTPVASLASLISYRIYAASEGSSSAKYMVSSLAVNFAMLAVMLLFAIFIIR